MPDKIISTSAVSYGIERINREVSLWMKGLSGGDDRPNIPFIATRGYDSVVWNRLYSRDMSDMEEHQNRQASKFAIATFFFSIS